MNHVSSNTDYDRSKPQMKLSDADVQLLRSALIEGDQAIARQKDVIALHKRIVTMFATLTTGIGEQHEKKASIDREILVHKLDDMGRAVNGMEAALRIEMAPALEAMLDEALDRRMPKQRSRWRLVYGVALGIGVGVAVGVNYPDFILESLDKMRFQTRELWEQILKLSPFGGI